ncbi:uncharacterized protein HMPREF1541_10917 [Cyphellophora europaea CBS 101466]|uniref:Uncharacterized protein n=1 Tax=Cyphellophora europaea (strain CBS 101466) TaxID=1220924 RepID=W2S5T3_CYPE1|nr:uncharacterized protein HMPREF1541_10917 [Cyphellophora europaea CBS 101466]ETN44052.1 hypothetical protein HMPREF1541_10917 [Cyphellophora europaea CBS 101466]
MTLLENSQYQDLVPNVTEPGFDLASNHRSDSQADLRDDAEQPWMEMTHADIQQASSVQDSEVHAPNAQDPDAQDTDAQDTDAQDTDAQDTDAQDADVQDTDIDWLDSEASDNEKLDCKEPFNKGSDTKETEERSTQAPSASPAGRVTKQLINSISSVAPSAERIKRIHSPSSQTLSKRIRTTQQVAVHSRSKTWGITNGNQFASRVDNIPEQIRFFDLHFDNDSKEYRVTRLRGDIRNWHDLQPDSTCTCQDETFRRGDLVHIKLHGKTDVRQGDNLARVDDIRMLSVGDERRLVLITWLYLADGRLYESNHLQIVLWDTITRRATQTLANKVQPLQLYNVCGGKKLCSAQQAERWHVRKARVLSQDYSPGPE